MGKLKALNKNLNLFDKRIILRLDLNVPLKEGKVTDKTRINKIIPILKNFIERKAKIILISHLGRPNWKPDEKLSLKPISYILKNLLNTKQICHDIINRITFKYEDKHYLKKYIATRVEEMVDINNLLDEDYE